MRPAFRRAAAMAVVLAAVLFGGSLLARCVVDEIAVPLVGLERLAQRPPLPSQPIESELVWENSGASIALQETAGEPIVLPADRVESRMLVKGPRDHPKTATRVLAVYENLEAIIMVKGKVTLHGGVVPQELSLDRLAQLDRDFSLSPLQRERIERWLAWKKEALSALGGKKDPNKVREIEASTAEAVRAELDFFQAQEFDRRRQGGPTILSFSEGSVIEIGAGDQMSLADYIVADQRTVLEIDRTSAKTTRVMLKTVE